MSWRKSNGEEGLPRKGADEQPLRAELFSVDQLERHAKAIAASHQLATGRARDKLIPRLDENERVLIETLRSRDGGRQAEPPHRAGGRMAARQFLPDRRADPDGPAAPAAVVQPGAAAPGERPGGELPAGLRHRPGADLARRWARRRRQPQRLHRLLPDGQAAEARRAVGDADHAAAGADRESAPRGGADRRRAPRSRPGRRLGRADGAASSSRTRPT